MTPTSPAALGGGICMAETTRVRASEYGGRGKGTREEGVRIRSRRVRTGVRDGISST